MTNHVYQQRKIAPRRPNFDDYIDPEPWAQPGVPTLANLGAPAELDCIAWRKERALEHQDRRLTAGVAALVILCLAVIAWAAFLAPWVTFLP